jgi:uncharacterized protein
MITVKTKLGISKIHGIGLFADEFIPKGTITWVFSKIYDQAFTKEQVLNMGEITLQQFFKYAYWDNGLERYVLCFDDQRFVNHSSDNANVESTPDKDVALRNIEPGEEILCDYTKFDPSYFDRIGFGHNKALKI